jgi:hypothetical protein
MLRAGPLSQSRPGPESGHAGFHVGEVSFGTAPEPFMHMAHIIGDRALKSWRYSRSRVAGPHSCAPSSTVRGPTSIFGCQLAAKLPAASFFIFLR